MNPSYNRINPFFAKIKKRYSLCQKGSLKETMHLELDLKGSGMHYQVGDSLAVLPENDPLHVQKLLDLLGASGKETIQPKKNKEPIPFRKFLLQNANLTDGTPKFIGELTNRQTNLKKKKDLEELISKGKIKEFIQKKDIVDILEENPESAFSPQELCDLLKPMMPRFYSIASSMKAVGEEVHLTVALQQWDLNGKQKLGICTHYLCNLAPLDTPTIPSYIHPHRGFTLPEDRNAPIIMVGPGTGIAPFRAFMQEREFLGCPGKNWLFFGEWNRKQHFFYKEFWDTLGDRGNIRVDVAFSRDQEHKIYVQHRMLEKGKELYRWLQEGAYFYVCGDAKEMAKDVDQALHQVVRDHGGLNEEKAVAYVKALKKEKRYLRDVY